MWLISVNNSNLSIWITLFVLLRGHNIWNETEHECDIFEAYLWNNHQLKMFLFSNVNLRMNGTHNTLCNRACLIISNYYLTGCRPSSMSSSQEELLSFTTIPWKESWPGSDEIFFIFLAWKANPQDYYSKLTTPWPGPLAIDLKNFIFRD